MPNEILFIVHALIMAFFALFTLRMGKSALIAFIAMQAVLANLFVLKQMDFFGFTITCTDVFAIGAIFSLNLLQEYFGKESVKKAIWITFFLLFFFMIAAQLHLIYTPSVSDTAHPHFEAVLGWMPRIVISSFIAFFVVQFLDMHFFAVLKRKLPLPLPIRIFLSLILSQLIDTILFSMLALYGIVSSIMDIIVVSFSIKVLIILLSAPFSLLSKQFYRKEAL